MMVQDIVIEGVLSRTPFPSHSLKVNKCIFHNMCYHLYIRDLVNLCLFSRVLFTVSSAFLISFLDLYFCVYITFHMSFSCFMSCSRTFTEHIYDEFTKRSTKHHCYHFLLTPRSSTTSYFIIMFRTLIS